MLPQGVWRARCASLAVEGRRLPVLLIVHAVVFGAWALLAIVQPALIIARSPAWHRRLGWFGTGLAVGIVVLGASAILMALFSDNLRRFIRMGCSSRAAACIAPMPGVSAR